MYSFDRKPRAVPSVETKYRRIKTEIPNPQTTDVIDRCIKFEPCSMNDQLPVVWEKAEDFLVSDTSGNIWLDFTSCIFVANVGHGNPEVTKAISKMVSQPLLNAYYYQTEVRANLVEELVKVAPERIKKALLLSTGAEATEAAFKTATNFGRRISPTKEIVLSFEGSFHGKTMGAQTLGGKPKGKTWIKQLQPNVFQLPYPYPWVLQKKEMSGEEFFNQSISELETRGVNFSDVAAVFAEPYQGWCAVFFPKDYIQALRKWCDENKTLLAFDEIQGGFGRTGKMFGFEHYDIDPDIICCGKALSGSLPVSAVLGIEDFFGDDFSLNSTHGGNPVGAAASFASLRYLQDHQLCETALEKGEQVQAWLKEWQRECPDVVGDIYGAGMVWAIFIKKQGTDELDADLTDRLIERAMEKGLLSIRTQCGTLKLGPPLTMPLEALKEGIDVLKESLNEVLKES